MKFIKLFLIFFITFVATRATNVNQDFWNNEFGGNGFGNFAQYENPVKQRNRKNTIQRTVYHNQPSKRTNLNYYGNYNPKVNRRSFVYPSRNNKFNYNQRNIGVNKGNYRNNYHQRNKVYNPNNNYNSISNAGNSAGSFGYSLDNALGIPDLSGSDSELRKRFGIPSDAQMEAMKKKQDEQNKKKKEQQAKLKALEASKASASGSQAQTANVQDNASSGSGSIASTQGDTSIASNQQTDTSSSSK